MATQKDFKVKNGLIVGGNSSITGNLTVTGTVNGRSQLVDSAEVIKLIESTFDSDNTLSLVDSDYVTQRSYAHHYYVKAAEAISAGEVVMFGGVQGDHVLAKVCDPSAVGFIPEWVMGVANTSIALNAWGRVTATGRLEGINTSSFSNGDLLYMDPSTAGALTTTKPSPPNHAILVCAVLKAAAGTSGIIQVRLTHNPDTDEVPEGSSNLYYTTVRHDSDAGVYLTTNSYATQSYVSTQINNLIDGAPGTLDTLNEIAAALNDDDSAYGTLVGLINAKDSDYIHTAISVTDAGGAGSLSYSSGVITYNGATTADFPDSAGVNALFDTRLATKSTTDLSEGNNLYYTTARADSDTSAYLTANSYATQSYVTGLNVSTFTNDVKYLDSSTVTGIIGASYIQSNQITYNTSDFTDSSYADPVGTGVAMAIALG